MERQSLSAAGIGDPPDGATLPVDLAESCRAVLEANWYRAGYTVPNRATYPYQWLWDSCFHAIVWARLGEADRAISEIRHLFRTQDRAGFVPHIDYEIDPTAQSAFWGRDESSSITQPPLYGHTLAELSRSGVDVPGDLIDHATAGLWFLLRDRQREPATGLITIVHPWESGADDSPRWDHWAGDPFDPAVWFTRKGELIAPIDRSSAGSPLSNPAFGAAPAGFNALVVFNARELASIAGDRDLERAADELAAALDQRWDATLATWIDAGPSAQDSGRIRTLEALLPVLVTGDDERVRRVIGDLLDAAAYGAPYGPRGVHRGEPGYRENTYWRGPAWPQLSYLVWLSAVRQGRTDAASRLARSLIDGARTSGFAEYWNAENGTALGARPQSWATLALLVS